jgi:UDPglucose 6-dehydrogenase
MKPDRVIVGVEADEARAVIEELYSPFVRTGNPLIFMDLASAEMTKYAANAMLATRISFMNQMAELCEAVGADVALVRRGVGSDPRIGAAFLFPGPGYGGSCFPKDVQALIRTGEEHRVSLQVLKAVEAVNHRQKRRVLEKLTAALDGALGGRRIAVWGLAFKAETDDVRESPALELVRGLLDAGATVAAHDPQAMESARRLFGDRVTYVADPYETLRDADALAIMTEWLAFRNPDFDVMKARLRRPVVVDGRNLYDPDKMRRLGFRYFGIGRGVRP